MKNLTIIGLILLMVATTAVAQQTNSEITRRNSWIKAGASLGIPVGSLADRASVGLSFDLKGQFLSTPHVGLGIATGYTHYFPKENYENFGSVPLGLFARYYVGPQGLFVGTDVGYSFQTGSGNNGNGGIYIKPEIGYHNRLWNVFGFYNGVFRDNQEGGSLQQVGVGFAYNFMFN